MRFRISKIKNENLNKKIIKVLKLLNFKNQQIFLILTICKTIKIEKNFEFDGKLSNMYFECSNNLNNHKNKE